MQTTAFSAFERSFSLATGQVMAGIVNFLPSIIGAIVLFSIGLLIADWLKTATTKIVNVTKISSLFNNPAVKDFLKNAQLSQKVDDILGEAVKWLVIILFFVASVNLLGITSISVFLNTVVASIPTVVSAIVTLIIGVFVAGFLEKLVKGSLGSGDPSMSRFTGKVVSYAVLTFFTLAALSQLGIASFFINTVFIGFVLAIALALGLGLGLGSKDIIKKLLEDWYKKIEK